MRMEHRMREGCPSPLPGDTPSLGVLTPRAQHHGGCGGGQPWVSFQGLSHGRAAGMCWAHQGLNSPGAGRSDRGTRAFGVVLSGQLRGTRLRTPRRTEPGLGGLGSPLSGERWAPPPEGPSPLPARLGLVQGPRLLLGGPGGGGMASWPSSPSFPPGPRIFLWFCFEPSGAHTRPPPLPGSEAELPEPQEAWPGFWSLWPVPPQQPLVHLASSPAQFLSTASWAWPPFPRLLCCSGHCGRTPRAPALTCLHRDEAGSREACTPCSLPGPMRSLAGGGVHPRLGDGVAPH